MTNAALFAIIVSSRKNLQITDGLEIIMAKSKKNRNYVTEKTSAAKAQKELEILQKKRNKKIKTILISTISVALVVGGIIGALFASGAFDYRPEGTYDVLVTVEGYGSLHVELYGNDAPETVEHFLKLVNSGYYNGKSIFKLTGDLAYAGDKNASDEEFGIKGEFSENGVDNKVMHKRGVLSMARGEDADSAYGQFFIVMDKSPELNGKYAAFGKVTSGMEILEEIYKNLETDENGVIVDGKAPVITSISSHESHDH